MAKKIEMLRPTIVGSHIVHDELGFEGTQITVELENADAEFVARLALNIAMLVKNPQSWVMTYQHECQPLIK